MFCLSFLGLAQQQIRHFPKTTSPTSAVADVGGVVADDGRGVAGAAGDADGFHDFEIVEIVADVEDVIEA